jgi:hypothetical protein
MGLRLRKGLAAFEGLLSVRAPVTGPVLVGDVSVETPNDRKSPCMRLFVGSKTSEPAGGEALAVD